MAKKNTEEVPDNINTQLDKDRKEQNLSAPNNRILDKLLDPDKKDLKNQGTTDKQLSDSRSKPDGHKLTESLLNSSEIEDMPKRGENDSLNVLPNNIETALSDKKTEKAFNLKSYYESFSQLQNNPDRFNNNKKVKNMVMASLQDADAMLYFIYHQANNQNRELTIEEKALIDGISADKQKLIVYLLNEI